MTAGIAVEALTLTLGAFRLKNIGFAVAPGEILVILGPNGAGKSVTLEAIAGFHRPASGRVRIAGRDVTELPPERRYIGFVVQDYGLFPHLTVAHNVGMAQRRKRAVPRHNPLSVPQGDAAALLDYFKISHLAQRAPDDLSPGEKQRAALARALAGAPDVFLFDEPFSVLDAETRDELRDELKSFLRALAIPAIFVSHDRADAMTLADKIVILRDGAMTQAGTATEVLQTPADAFVARFLGVENILPGEVTGMSDGFARVAVGERFLWSATTAAAAFAPASKVLLSIRAEDVRIWLPRKEEPPQTGINRLAGRVVSVRGVGALFTVQLDCGFPLKAYLLAPQARDMHLDGGGSVAVDIAPTAIHVMAK